MLFIFWSGGYVTQNTLQRNESTEHISQNTKKMIKDYRTQNIKQIKNINNKDRISQSKDDTGDSTEESKWGI